VTNPLEDHPLLEASARSDDSELRSLFTLLDDPDAGVAKAVEARLRARGEFVINPLLDFLGTSHDTLAIKRAAGIVRELTSDVLAVEFEALRMRLEEQRKGGLEDGAFLIARFGYPQLDVEYYKAELDALAGMLYDRIAGIHSPVEILAATNDFFFKEKKFRGNHQNFLEADNSYINQVLDRRLGIPISLATIYLLVAARRLGLPFSGASTPGHFLIRYDGVRDEPLFIDAFNGGIVLRREDIRRFLYTSGMPYYESFIMPSRPRNILLRMMRNLIIFFEETKDESSKLAFERFHHILMGSDADPTKIQGCE
jgi:regulator of sirC expression with transglutaminase-like and TPR domain